MENEIYADPLVIEEILTAYGIPFIPANKETHPALIESIIADVKLANAEARGE